MTTFILACTLWSLPTVNLVEVPVSEYAMAEMNHTMGDFHFEATVVEEKMNSVKIIHLPTQTMSQAHSPSDYQQRSMSLRMDTAGTQASMDCDVRQK